MAFTDNYKEWLESEDIRPYVFVRPANLPHNPGTLHQFSFPHAPLLKDPFLTTQADFATQILALENRAFQASGMILPRWAFYDCSLMPGIVSGFAMRTKAIPSSIKKVLPLNDQLEWTPISLFICIPTAEKDHWVAHNLCSVSSILEKKDRWSSLGFLTKAYALWYFNVSQLYGMTQWGSPALKVHTNYGNFQIKSAYNLIHDYAETITYLVDIEARYWKEYLEDQVGPRPNYQSTNITIPSSDKHAMLELQKRIEKGSGPYYIDGRELISDDSLKNIKIYTF
ncbi:MAG: hypothetical protein AB7F59_06655 [Bdellovibrionales bacterium]